MTESERDKGEAEPEQEAVPAGNVTDLLVALQKSLSRVSDLTADVPERGSRSLILGNVEFEIETRVELRDDTLRVEKTGETVLKLQGTVNHDIREEQVESPEESTG